MSRPPKVSASGLRTMLDTGMRVGEIAAATGHVRSSIGNQLRAHGIDPKSRPGRPSKLPPLDVLIERLEAGERPSAIAKACSATPSAVHLALYAAGLRLDRGRIYPKES